MEYKVGRPNFFKLYHSVQRVTPPGRIYLYYGGRPLYCPAVFTKDRYMFELPVGLQEKMLAGELIADFKYSNLPSGGPIKFPDAIILSDRYA